jgi:hypothetical protein
MNKTWTSGAVELLEHASGHIKLDNAFDKRIAFISIDNAVEIVVKTYLSLPKQFFGTDRPSRKEIDDCNNGFTSYLSLLFKYADNKLIGIDPGDIEHYHRIRNTLYHDGTGLAVDQEYINAYFTISKLLLKRLFNIDILEQHEEASLEKIIINWNHIEECLAEIFESGLVHTGTYKWEDAISKGLLTIDLIKEITSLRLLRNQIVHSKSIDSSELRETYQKSKLVLQELKNQVEFSREAIKSRNFFYEPNISEIKGKLTLNKFFGPPTYGENPENDMIEDVWILNPLNSINVHQDKPELEESDLNLTQYNVQRIQLATTKNNIKLEKYENQTITLTGKFFGAHTRHHFTAVLLQVISVKPD